VGDPSAAALVDGEVVATPADVATILEEFPLELAGGQAPPPGQIVSFLALDGPVRELAIQTETPVVDQVRRGSGSPRPTTPRAASRSGTPSRCCGSSRRT
jgi:hypothetical protein